MSQVRSMKPGKERERRHRIGARGLLAAGLAILHALAACSPTPPREPTDPTPPTGGPSMSAPATMYGETRATLNVRVEGEWQLRVLESEESGASQIASRVSLSRTTGTGNGTVTLKIDPTGLDLTLDYQFRVQLQAEGRTTTRAVDFTFPYITGYALLGSAAVGADLQAELTRPGAVAVVVEPEVGGADATGTEGAEDPGTPDATSVGNATGDPDAAPLRPLNTAPDAELGADALSAELGAEPGDTVTLLVGLEPADAGQVGELSDPTAASDVIGAPAPAALSALSASVGRIAGAAVESRFDEAGLVFVEVPAAEVEEAVAQLEMTRGVRYVELPVPIYPFSNDQFRHLQWNLDRVEVEQLWPVSDGSGVRIAVLDNGFYPNHPDLAPNVVGQYDAGDETSSVESGVAVCGTHGTHVAGIAAAVANNQIGVAGTAPGAGLYLVDLDYRNRAGCPMDSTSLVRGIQHVVNGGSPRAHVMNLSLGTSTPLGQGTVDALRAAQSAGIVMVGAAGNTACVNGQPTNVPVSYPAAYEQVWAVRATNPDNGRACYSHVGPELFIAAPGR